MANITLGEVRNLLKATADWVQGLTGSKPKIKADDGDLGGIGATTDAAVTPGAAGSVNAKLRQMSGDLATLVQQTDGLEALLTAIRDTAGIKKITDPVDILDRAARQLGIVDTPDLEALIGALNAAAVTDPAAASAATNQLLRGLLKQLQGTGSGAAPVTLNGSFAQSLRDAGFEPVISWSSSTITPGSTVTLISEVTEPCVIDALEFSGGLALPHEIYVELRNNAGTYSPIRMPLASVVNPFVDITQLNNYGHALFEVLKYDTTIQRFKFGAKRPIPAPRGFRIRAKNSHTSDIIVTCSMVYRKLATP